MSVVAVNVSNSTLMVPPEYGGGVVNPNGSATFSDSLSGVLATFALHSYSVVGWQFTPSATATPISGDAYVKQSTLDGGDTANPVIGTGAGQTDFRGGAKVASAKYALHATRVGLITDYDVAITDVSAPVIYQAVSMGAVAGKTVPLIVRDATNSVAFGTPLANSITLKPLAGKKLNNAVDGTLVILNGGGVIAVMVDENDNMFQIGLTA